MSYDAPDPDGIDIGDDHQIKFFCWAPDRTLNPQYAGMPDIEKAGCMIWHKNPKDGSQCCGAINFESMRALVPDRAIWQVQSLDPLTVSPSVLCMRCGDHGFIRNGRWVKA